MTEQEKWNVFIFPSLFEELFLATVEALISELVCVGWKIDALEAVWGDAGILLPYQNVKLLAQTMAELISDSVLVEKWGLRTWNRAKK